MMTAYLSNELNSKVSLHPILLFTATAIILPTVGIASHAYGQTKGENELLYNPLYSKQYNQADGFFGITNKHTQDTQDYLYGYENGFQVDKGFADGPAGFPKSMKTSTYLSSYDFGVQNRVTN